jgi:3-methyladenine DNA glycosylase AlkD
VHTETAPSTTKPPTARAVATALKALGSPAKAKASAWFFKTGAGQYGHGDVFVGVTVPEQRRLAKRFEALAPAELSTLLASKLHECRLTALLILVRQYERGDEAARRRIARFYLARRKAVNNWDLVDSSAPYILGRHLLARDRAILHRFARSRDLWERRIAIVATLAFIREGDFADMLAIAERLLGDPHDFIHKATGWMLREVGKRGPGALERFLAEHAARMPRTMLRYAIERFPERKRKAYLAVRLRFPLTWILSTHQPSLRRVARAKRLARSRRCA